MERNRNNLNAFPPPAVENKPLLRSISEEKGGLGEDQMIDNVLRPLSFDRLPTSQRPISVTGWSLTIATGAVLWALIFHFVA